MHTSSRNVRFSLRGRRDIRAVLQYTSKRWGSKQRSDYRASLDDAFRRVGAFPSLGRQRDELGVGVRSYAVAEHVILYRQEGNEIVVLRVMHGRQDLSRLSIP